MIDCSPSLRYLVACAAVLVIVSLGSFSFMYRSNIRIVSGSMSSFDELRHRDLTFFSTSDDDRHNPNVLPRNSTNPPYIPRFSMKPSNGPSRRPTRRPTVSPTVKQSKKPTSRPTVRGTMKQSNRPNFRSPTSRPSAKPFVKTRKPTSRRSARPSVWSVAKPSTKPTSLRPTSSKPSIRRTVNPTAILSSRPSPWSTTKPTVTCSSANGLFGDTNGEDVLLVSYTYELVMKDSNIFSMDGSYVSSPSDAIDAVASLEAAILNQVIASMFTNCGNRSPAAAALSVRSLQNNSTEILGISSNPTDLITYDTCIVGSQIPDTSCSVVSGRLTMFVEDPSSAQFLYAKSLEAIKVYMDNFDAKISPNIVRVIYVDTDEDKEIIVSNANASIKSASNVAPILSALGGFLLIILLLLFLLKRRNEHKRSTYILKENSNHSIAIFYGRDSERLGIDPVEDESKYRLRVSLKTDAAIPILECSTSQDRLGIHPVGPQSKYNLKLSPKEINPPRSPKNSSPSRCKDKSETFIEQVPSDNTSCQSAHRFATELAIEVSHDALSTSYNDANQAPIVAEPCASSDDELSSLFEIERDKESDLNSSPRSIPKSPISSLLMDEETGHQTASEESSGLNLSPTPDSGEDRLTSFLNGMYLSSPSIGSKQDTNSPDRWKQSPLAIPKSPILSLLMDEESGLKIHDDSNDICLTPLLDLGRECPTPVSYGMPLLSPRNGSRYSVSPVWLNHQGTKLRIESNKSDAVLCILCNKEAIIAFTSCSCGNAGCKKVAHTACLLGPKSPLPSLSYPGTPPPTLPPVFCSGGAYPYKRAPVPSLE